MLKVLKKLVVRDWIIQVALTLNFCKYPDGWDSAGPTAEVTIPVIFQLPYILKYV
jgi:hypothetical protein